MNELEMTYLLSLWNLLNFKKAVLLTEHGQDPFDELHESFKESLQQYDIKNLINKLLQVFHCKS